MALTVESDEVPSNHASRGTLLPFVFAYVVKAARAADACFESTWTGSPFHHQDHDQVISAHSAVGFDRFGHIHQFVKRAKFILI